MRTYFFYTATILAAIGFIVSAVVHGLTFMPDWSPSMDVIWPLCIGAIPLLVHPLWIRHSREKLIRQARQKMGMPRVDIIPYIADRDWAGYKRALAANNGEDELYRFVPADTPRWMTMVAAVLFVYAVINIVMHGVNLSEGEGAIMDGKYVLQLKGHFVREISYREYMQHLAMEARGPSGHIMVFYFFLLSNYVGELKRKQRKMPGLKT